jgi:hypothetical protein
MIFFQEYVKLVLGGWLTPAIPATWETEIGRKTVPGQPRQIILKTPIFKITREK